MLRSLDAHADEEWIMVGTHNTVDVAIECQVHVGGYGGFFRKGGHWYLQNTVGVWGAPPRVPGMVDPGVPYRCPEAWGAFCRMGAQRRP